MMVAMQPLLIHLGYKAEENASVLDKTPGSREEAEILKLLKKYLKKIT
jgi:Holliday junction resolvasome RuvABC DNA-binding subunit